MRSKNSDEVREIALSTLLAAPSWFHLWLAWNRTPCMMEPADYTFFREAGGSSDNYWFSQSRAFVLCFCRAVAGDFLPFPIWRAAYAVAASGELTGPDDLFAGRALSLIALAAVAFEIFAAVRTLCSGPTFTAAPHTLRC
jgi:hypothetical protein